MPHLDLSVKTGRDALTILLRDSKAARKKPDDDRVSQPHPLYGEMIIAAREMGVHIWGDKPEKLLNVTRPREEPEITQYRLDTYEAITQSKADKAFTILLKIFNTKLWSIIYKDNTQGQELKLFLERNFYLFGDFILYIQKVLMKNMLADANGVVFYRPENFFIPQSETIKPIPVIFESWQVLKSIPGVFYLLLDAKVEKIKNREIHRVWLVDFEKIQLWKEKHVNNGTIWENEIDWFHGFGLAPAWELGGMVDGRHQGFFFKSFFSPASPHWNKAIISESDLDGAFYLHMHPIRIEVGTDCDFQWNDQQCRNGQIFDKVKNKSVECALCKGTGRKSVKSPYGVYLINKGKFDADDAGLTPVSFATVPTEPTSLLIDRRDTQLNEGLEALNMEVATQIGENQSGIAKEIDRDPLNTTLQTISDHVFTVQVFNFIWFTGIYLFKTSSGLEIERFTEAALSENGWFPAIVKPTQFDTLTIKELTKQLTEAKEGGLSSGYVDTLQVELNNKQFSSNPALRKRINAITKLNPIPEKTVDQITNMVENGLTKRENAVISLNIEFLVDTAIIRDEGFFEKTREEKFQILQNLVVEFELFTPPSSED